MRKGGSVNATKTRKRSKEEVRKQMIDSLSNSKKVEKKNLNKQADKVKNCEEATIIVKEYEHIIRKKKKNIISVAYQQGKVFKRFKEQKKILNIVKGFKVNNKILNFF